MNGNMIRLLPIRYKNVVQNPNVNQNKNVGG